jgi:DNA-binding transcriptional ArsR family regulator
MRPLFHPPVETLTVQGVLYALSDPVRLRIYIDLLQASCSQNCSFFSHSGDTSLPKSTLSQHFKILREAGLIYSERKGVEVKNVPRYEDLKKTAFWPMIEGIIEAYRAEEKNKKKKTRK